MPPFRDQMLDYQLQWKARRLPLITEAGYWEGRQYNHILPGCASSQNLWPGLLDGGVRPLEPWLTQHQVQAHEGRGNLLSSWTLCANLYFPFGVSPEARLLLAGFLQAKTGLPIKAVTSVELEFALPHPNDPETLLGERGQRGRHQTSPDVAFVLQLNDDSRALVLTEVKFTERSFYECSGYRQLSESERKATCLKLADVLDNPATRCVHAAVRGRRYWVYLAAPLRKGDAQPHACPAARGGYQLFRQQALAEALVRKDGFSAVVSSIAYDARNTDLLGSVVDVDDVRNDWAPMFAGRAGFATWSHQDWFCWVNAATQAPDWTADWRKWVGDRYGYAAEAAA